MITLDKTTAKSFDELTLEDCASAYERNGTVFEINDGKITRFAELIDCSNE